MVFKTRNLERMAISDRKLENDGIQISETRKEWHKKIRKLELLKHGKHKRKTMLDT